MNGNGNSVAWEESSAPRVMKIARQIVLRSMRNAMTTDVAAGAMGCDVSAIWRVAGQELGSNGMGLTTMICA